MDQTPNSSELNKARWFREHFKWSEDIPLEEIVKGLQMVERTEAYAKEALRMATAAEITSQSYSSSGFWKRIPEGLKVSEFEDIAPQIQLLATACGKAQQTVYLHASQTVHEFLQAGEQFAGLNVPNSYNLDKVLEEETKTLKAFDSCIDHFAEMARLDLYLKTGNLF